MKKSTNRLVLFVSFLIAQLVISDFINFGPLFFFAIYPLFILMLPISLSPITVMLWAFTMGVSVDLFSNGMMGIHSASLVMMAYLRSPLLKVLIRKGEYENIIRPGISTIGFSRFSIYLLISIAIHHFTYIMAESFTLNYFIGNLPRLLLSLVSNFILLQLIEFGIFYKYWK